MNAYEIMLLKNIARGMIIFKRQVATPDTVSVPLGRKNEKVRERTS